MSTWVTDGPRSSFGTMARRRLVASGIAPVAADGLAVGEPDVGRHLLIVRGMDHLQYNAQRGRSEYAGLLGTGDHQVSWAARFCGLQVRE